jgi:hypothetical protein
VKNLVGNLFSKTIIIIIIRNGGGATIRPREFSSTAADEFQEVEFRNHRIIIAAPETCHAVTSDWTKPHSFNARNMT